jgi:hypothetical protein
MHDTGSWVGVDTVVVPAGTFTCYKFVVTVHLMASASGLPLLNKTFVRTTWLASNVGIVKDSVPTVNINIQGQGKIIPGYENDLRSHGKTTVSVKQIGFGAPALAALGQNYPNPFSDNTSLQFSIPSEQNISLKLYDALGRYVGTLLQGNIAAGTYSSEFNASDIPNGAYMMTLETFTQKISRQIVIAR